MDVIYFWFKLLAMGFVLSMCQAINCNWKTQYEMSLRCCDACPSGEYPKQVCNDVQPTVCEKCSAGHGNNTRCACGDNLLCTGIFCTDCRPRPLCKQGQELRRKGKYMFNYVCEACNDTSYNDAEDSMCKPLTDCKACGLSTLSAGNRTHNTRCAVGDHFTDKVMEICVAITGFICVAQLIIICKHKKRKNKHQLTHPVDCQCKLSKEEMGDKSEPYIGDLYSETSIKHNDV